MESLRTPVPPFENTVSAQATGLLQAGPAFVRTYGGGLQGRMVRSLEMAQIPLRSDETDELMEQQYRYGATLVPEWVVIENVCGLLSSPATRPQSEGDDHD